MRGCECHVQADGGTPSLPGCGHSRRRRRSSCCIGGMQPGTVYTPKLQLEMLLNCGCAVMERSNSLRPDELLV